MDRRIKPRKGSVSSKLKSRLEALFGDTAKKVNENDAECLGRLTMRTWGLRNISDIYYVDLNFL